MEPRKIITNGNRISRDFQEVRCGRELCSGRTNNGIGHDVATVTKDDFSKNTHSTHHMAIRAANSEDDHDTEEEPKESNILNIFDHLDHSVLQTPFSLGVPSVSRVLQYLRNGTQEVKDVILNECNLIYECKVCRSLFRSLANLLAHKRFYCKKFSNESFGHIDKKASLSVSDESVKKRSSLDAQKDLTSDDTSPPHIDCCNSSVQTEENKERDVTGIPIVKESSFYIDSLQKDLKKKICYEEIAVDLKPIEGNSNAVFQVIKSSQVDTKTSNEMLRGEQVILQRTTEGKMDLVEDCMPEELPPSGAPFSRAKRLGGRSDCNIKTLTCLRCRTRYTSLKTLNLHMMTVHAPKRTYFPCPFCETTFVQMWGVTRHLMTVHKKTKDQVDRLRGRIKRRAFVKNIETDTDIESGRRNNNSEENNDPISDLRHTLKYFKKQSQTNRNFQFHHCSKCWRVFGRQSSRISHEKFCFFSPKKTKKKFKSEKDSTKSLTSVCENVKLKSNKTTKTNVIIKRQKKIIRSPKNGVLSCHLAQTRQPNLEEKVLALINSDTLTCQKCNRKFSTYSNLRRHVAIHVGWRRFKCKHCSYKAYNRSDCRNHVKRVHLGVGAAIAKVERMIVHLPALNSTSITLENETSHNSAGHVTTPPCTRSLQLTSTKSKRKLSARTEIVKTNKRKSTSNGSQSEKHRNRRSKSNSSSRSSSLKTSPSDGSSNHNSCFPRHSSPSASYCEPSSISTLVTRAGIYP
ncbi:uncharacterized protein LOC143240359 [Tachypleus tridentatus]|uniref:uncharacterized protein LOC143240359 n=1 Tax=Tachypleus tridentatus TaxID=6853 RepID=UPI003FD53050